MRDKSSNKDDYERYLEPPLSSRDGGEEAGGHDLWHVGPQGPLAAVGEEQRTHITWEADYFYDYYLKYYYYCDDDDNNGKKYKS